MAKSSKADIEAQIAALQAQLAEDDGLELVVDMDGKKTTLRGSHAKRWLAKLGLDDDDQGDAGDDDQGDAGDGDPAPPKVKMRARFFESGS